MNLKDYVEGDSVSVEVVRASPTKLAKVVESGAYRITQWGEKPCIVVELDSKRKKYYPNKASARNIASAYGLDTTLWIGKYVQLRVEIKGQQEKVVGFALPAGVTPEQAIKNLQRDEKVPFK